MLSPTHTRLGAVGAGLDHRPGGGAAGYQDASCANRAALIADWPDTLRLTTGGQAAHDVRVYADFNNDGNFDPATERLYEGLGVRNPAVTLRTSGRSRRAWFTTERCGCASGPITPVARPRGLAPRPKKGK